LVDGCLNAAFHFHIISTSMPQPIAGVAPSQIDEVTVMTVWPSLAATAFGRFWGRLYAWDYGPRLLGVPVTVGRLLALASSPLMAAAYFLMRLPWWSWQYRLTNRRLVVESPYGQGEFGSIALDQFDAIVVDVRSGQRWYKAGDLVFRRDGAEVFRIWGVQRPETFRQTCLKAHVSYLGVQQAREMGAAV
jgi:hypothetical protein